MSNGTVRGADIAVVGAAGKTGSAVVDALADTVGVRRLVRRARSQFDHEVELETGTGLRKALLGCRAVYFIAPNVHPDEPNLLRNTLTAAASAGVDHFVYHSVAWPYTPAMPHHMDKAKCEDELHRSPLKWSVLQPCAYVENFAGALSGDSTRVTLPYSPDTRFSFVRLHDVAAVAAAVLTEGERHHCATYELGGPQALSVRELLRGSGAEIEQISLDQWQDSVSGSMPTGAIARLRAMFDFYDHHDFLAGSAAVQFVLGRPASDVDTVVAG
ncbi:NmrA family NAD(P)-binding protein [Rhodococcoides fascians]|uniref:NmrA family NAD(P)-binding protein n=1 Tax=Rhodococcoides fascians TaxID=1828 RepID=UPI0005692C52|nr:NmrA family NAD(P)-binding protein [Rhodococcus fascians]